MALVSLTFAAKKPPLTGQKKKAEIEAIDALIAQGQKQLKYNLDSIDVAITSLQEANSRSEEIDYYNGKSKSAYQLGHAYMRLSDNEMENVIADADLIYLGTNQFRSQAEGLYHEMKHFNPELTHKQWDKIQVDFIEKHHYHTDFCKKYYKPRKQRNLAQLKREAKIK